MARIVTQKENSTQRVTMWDLTADISARADADVSADIRQRLNLSLPGDRSLTVALTRGGYRTRYDFETDTLEIGCDETDVTEDDCHDELGDTGTEGMGSVLAANIFFCSTPRVLAQIEHFLDLPAPTTVHYFVYQAHDDTILSENIPMPRPIPNIGTNEAFGVIDPTNDNVDELHRLARRDFTAPFDLLARATVDGVSGRSFHSSGPIEVPLMEGKFYIMGAAWQQDAAKRYWISGHPTGVSFGRSLAGLTLAFDGSLPKTLLPSVSSSAQTRADEQMHHQRLTLSGKGVDPATGGADLFILDTDGIMDLRVGTVNVTDADIANIFTNVAIGTVVGGPATSFFDGPLDPPVADGPKYAVKVNEIMFRIRRGTPESCRCNQKFYREPKDWLCFDTKEDARAHFDSLEPVPQASILVSEGSLEVTACRGGPFIPDEASFSILNTGSFPVTWEASVIGEAPWLQLSFNDVASDMPTGTLVNVGDVNILIARIVDPARSFCTGIYPATIAIVNKTNGAGSTERSVVMEIRGKPSPEVDPDAPYEPEGKQGGPFSPSNMTWLLINTDECPLSWEVTESAEWLSMSPTSGTLDNHGSIMVTASLTPEADLLAPDKYEARIVFRNLTSGRETVARTVTLRVRV